MMFSFTSVNWLAVLAGMVVSMVLGALWYGPLFGNTWLRLIGKSADEIEPDPMSYLKTAVAALIAMLFLSMLISSLGTTSFVGGLIAGALTFIAFGAIQTFVYTTFEGPSERVWLLFGAYQVLWSLPLWVGFSRSGARCVYRLRYYAHRKRCAFFYRFAGSGTLALFVL